MTYVYFALSVLVPLALAATLVFRDWQNGWPLLGLIGFTLGGLFFAYFNAPWFLYSYWLLALIVLLVVASIVKGLWSLRAVSWKRPGVGTLITTIALFMGTAYFGSFASSVMTAMQAPADVVELDFPLRDGIFAIVQGGSAPPLQRGHARTPSQIYALDVIRLDKFGVTSPEYLGSDSSNDYTMGETVYSPCDGEVVWVRDGLPNEPDFESDTPAGNAIAIACKGVVIGFGHFYTDSITVSTGDNVTIGQTLGRVGLSGNTRGPHLHFHAERGEWQGDFSTNPGVAMTFDGEFLWDTRLLDLRQ